LSFVLPAREGNFRWAKVVDTSQRMVEEPAQLYVPGQEVAVYARTLMVMRLVEHPQAASAPRGGEEFFGR